MVFSTVFPASVASASVNNYNPSQNQIQRFDTSGNAIDAYDGKIEKFNGIYYLYGTSYSCGYQLMVASSPFCGFKSYSSSDLVNWTDKGLLFSPVSWQSNCVNGKYGCYRPHVLFNAATGKYVLWFNSYDNASGFHVLTSSSPTSGFVETTTVTSPLGDYGYDGPYQNGDFDLFQDSDGSAYIAYTTRLVSDITLPNHILRIQKLNSSFTDGVGPLIDADTNGGVEAPSLTKRGNTYYLVYGPECAYCGHTPTVYQSTTDITQWSGARTEISSDSCGGQSSFVSKVGSDYIYGSDLWATYNDPNITTNQSLANYFWKKLSFTNNSIDPIGCEGQVGQSVVLWKNWCDITTHFSRAQVFVAPITGKMSSFSVAMFGMGNTVPATFQIFNTVNGIPSGRALATYSKVIDNWSVRNVKIPLATYLTKSKTYAIVITNNSSSCYGWTYKDSSVGINSYEMYLMGNTWRKELNRNLKFSINF